MTILVSKISEETGKLIRDNEDFVISDPISAGEKYIEFLKNTLSMIYHKLEAISSKLGVEMNQVLQINSNKLLSRLERGKINGFGDNR